MLESKPPPFPPLQPYRPPPHRGPSYYHRQERRKAAESAAAPNATSNIIVDAEQVDTPDQAEQARNMLTVVSEQDQQETPKAEEAIDNSEMQEPVDLAEN